jgi:hypothetical protein
MSRRDATRLSRPLLIVVAVTALTPAAMAETRPPAVSFSLGGPLTVDCATMKKRGVVVEVRNETAHKETVHLVVSALTDAAGAVSSATKVCRGITVHPSSLTLKPVRSGLVKLRSGASGKAGTTYGGSLGAAAAGGPAARLALTVAAAPAGTVAPAPLTATVTETIYRGSPHGQDSLMIAVRAEPSDKLALADKQVVGAVDGAGRTGVVSYDQGNLKKLSEGAALAHFVITGLDGATGTFSGKITLVPGDDKTAIAVTVTRKDWWLYPTLAVIAGIVAALISQRLAGVSIARHRLRARLAATGPRYSNARRKLVAAAAGAPWARFTLSDLATKRRTINQAIDQAAHDSYISISASKIDDVTAKVSKLEQSIDQLEGLDAHARPLQNAIDAAAEQAGAMPRQGSDLRLVEPVLITAKRPLLIGASVTIAALGQRLTDIDSATAAVTTVGGYEIIAANYSQNLDELAANLGADHQEQIRGAQGDLAGIWHDLWTAPSVDELNRRGVATHMGTVAATISQLWPLLPPTAAIAGFAPTADGTGGGLGAETLGLQASEPVDYTPAGVEHELKAARIEQGVVVALSFVVALTAALTTLYVGKVFGSFWDYVAAFTWGLATQTALATLASALDGLGGLSAIGRRVASA